MIKAISSCVFLLCVLSASASAQTLVISSITPQTGTTEGGTRVQILGQNLSNCTGACERPRIQFGNVDVFSMEIYSESRIDVVTPPHRAGGVQVLITRQNGMSALAPSAFTYVPTQNPVAERILLPILVDRVMGALGSIWESELSIHSRAPGLRTLSVVYRGCQLSACPSEPVVLDGGATRVFRGGGFDGADGSRPGVLLYLKRDEADLFAFSLHIKDRSRSTTTAGTEIPVVREGELSSGKLLLLNVPFQSGFRNLLRIYDPFPLGDSPVVKIRILSNADEILRELNVTLDRSSHNDLPHIPGYPGYAQVADFEDIQSRLGSSQTARIEIEPLTPGLKFWAFVAVTNNETQHVTTITPQ